MRYKLQSFKTSRVYKICLRKYAGTKEKYFKLKFKLFEDNNSLIRLNLGAKPKTI